MFPLDLLFRYNSVNPILPLEHCSHGVYAPGTQQHGAYAPGTDVSYRIRL